MNQQWLMQEPAAPAPLRSRVSGALTGVVIGAIALTPIIFLLGNLLRHWGLSSHPYVVVCLVLASPAVVSALFAWLVGARPRAAQRARLTAALHAALATRGLSPSAASPAARELRAALWRDAQRDLSSALLARRDQLLGPRTFAEITEHVYESRALLLFGLSCLISLGVMSMLWWSGLTGAASLLLFGVLLISLFIFLIVAVALLGRVDRAIAYQEFTREQRHIVSLAGLIDSTGGLSLVEDDVRSMLQGALSDAPKPGGQIELVEHPLHEGGS